MLNETLGLVIPTVHPERVFNRIFCDESLEQLKVISKVGTILINFQPPYTEEEINSIIDKLTSYDIPVKYSYNQYNVEKKGFVQFNKIRNDASKLLDCKFYVLVDDDFLFKGSVNGTPSSSHQYIEAVHYMLTHNNCGMVMLRQRKKSLDDYVPNGWVYPISIVNRWQTDSGMMLKSMKYTGEGNLFPDDSLELYGAGEEKILAGWRFSKGLYPARINHCNVSNSPSENLYSWYRPMHDTLTKYILDHYNQVIDDDYTKVCSEELYLSNGGIKYNEESINNLKFDYNNMTIDDMITDISKLIGE
jgi:hypothetical protein